MKSETCADITFAIDIIQLMDIELDSNLRSEFVAYNSIKTLYDITGSADNEPSRLNLSTGYVFNIKVESGQKAFADLISVPDQFSGYVIKTPNSTNGMFRDTRFYVSKSANINNQNNSPTEVPTWKNNFPA